MSEDNQQTQVRLAKRVIGVPADDAWTISHDESSEPGDGELAVKVEYVSLDPAMRGWMNEGRSYVPPVRIGDVMRAGGVGTVLASKDPGFQPGDQVQGMTGIQTTCVAPANDFSLVDGRVAPLPRYLGALGMPGMTAYFGLLDIGEPKEGETVLVSAAAGAVGSLVGQIARSKGCRAVGIAGGADKCRYVVEELGFDDCIDYKSGDFAEALKRSCPKRVDIYFDNVGGEMLEHALRRLNMGARIVLCGAISQYNSMENISGPRNYMNLLVSRARMEGFVVFDYATRFAEAAGAMSRMIDDGKLICKEHIVDGIETFPQTFRMLFSGENLGKLIIRV